MSRAVSIISEVETALHDASADKRMDVLRRVTDLFVGEAEHFTEDQTALFDSVLGQLVNHIESRAAVELSRRLAPIANAPPQTVRHLAGHDDIEVSGPILEKSERLSDEDLVAITKTKSQAHLAKIANRPRLNDAVTDALVEHGDSEVANTLATNSGAQFSKVGIAKLAMRADGDERLAVSIGRRSDIPPHVYRQLLAQASDIVRSKLLAAAPAGSQEAIKSLMAEISAQVMPKAAALHRYAAAEHTMRPFAQDTELTKKKILEFANTKRVAEVAVGLSILSGVLIEQLDRLFFTGNGFGLMVLCKSLAMSWQDASVIIMASRAAPQTTELCEDYAALTIPSAQRVLRFWQGRQKVAKRIFQTGP
jgi:Uncharacterised protein conserved in bacteria (DUF2336)